MEKPRSPSPPTARVVAVLEALSAAPDGLSSSALARDLGLSTSTAATILAALNSTGYVERQADKSYRLGPGLLRLLDGLRRRYPLLGVADVELESLASELDCGVTLARVTTDSLEVILTAGSTEDLDNRAGHRVPLDVPYGAVAMAWQDGAAIDEWLASSKSGRSATARQRMVLDDIRARFDPRALHVDPIAGVGQADAVARVQGVAHVTPVEGALEVVLDEGVDPQLAMRSLLEAMPMNRVEIKRPSLEDIFIEIVTGGKRGADAEQLRAELFAEPTNEGEAES